MKEELKKTYRGFLGWIRYVRDYKDNIDNDLIYDHKLIEKQREIDKQKVETAEYKYLVAERQKLIQLQEKRIQNLNKKITGLKKEKKELCDSLANAQLKMNVLEDKLNEKEQSRRASAGAIGGLKAKINDLTNELAKAEYTIEYYRNNRKKPNVEEIKAYEYSRKAVEKRIKDAEK